MAKIDELFIALKSKNYSAGGSNRLEIDPNFIALEELCKEPFPTEKKNVAPKVVALPVHKKRGKK